MTRSDGEQPDGTASGGDIQTFVDVLALRASDEHDGLLFEDSRWSWGEVVDECVARAHLLLGTRRPDRPFHVGVLLENVPEYLFVIGAAALCGATVVGINPTRRGAELAADIRHVDTDLIITDCAQDWLLVGLDTGVESDRVHRVDGDRYQATVAGLRGREWPDVPAAKDPSTQLLLLFTSGSTGAPKAVICSTGRFAGKALANRMNLDSEDVAYNAMPLFHGNALMMCWAPCVFSGATFAMRRRFSVSGFLPDVQRFGVTFFNYVGRSLAYLLSAPESPEEGRTRLRAAFGTEAAPPDRAEFLRRYGIPITESYGSSEGPISIRCTSGTPSGALGLPPAGLDVVVLDADGRECPRAEFDNHGRFRNAAEAVGELVNRTGAALFEGYYHNPEAERERVQGDRFHSGDLGFRDRDGFFYFAGRLGDRLRVDSENFSAAPVERILARFPGVSLVAVYPVPDPRTGDQVMATLVFDDAAAFDPEQFRTFLDAQHDLGTKWAPTLVRVAIDVPVTATHKIDKVRLRSEAWATDDPVYIYASESGSYVRLDEDLRTQLVAEFARHLRPAPP